MSAAAGSPWAGRHGSLIEVNGHELHYRDDDFTDPWDTPRTVLMQPYVFGCTEDLRAWVPALGRRARVLRLDRWGSGLSSRPPAGHRFTIEGFVSDYLAFLDALGVERVHYIGEALGGCLGIAFAAAHPDRVETLTLVATPLSIPPEFQRDYFIPDGFEDAPSAVRALGAWRYFRDSRLNDVSPAADSVQRLRNAARQSLRDGLDTHVLASLLELVTSPAFTVVPLLERIAVPTLLISASSSRSAPSTDQEVLLAGIRGSEQLVLDGVEPAWERPDEASLAAIRFMLRHAR